MRPAFFICLLFVASAGPTAHSFAEESSPWSYRGSAQGGGTLIFGEVAHEVDGERIATGKDPFGDESGDTTHFVVDARGSVAALWKRWASLSAQLGWSNWQSGYLRRASHRRSNYFGLGISPEARLPLGSCKRCPALYTGPKAGFALSLRDQRSLRAGAKENGRTGVGYYWGWRFGMDLTFHPRVGLRIESGYESTRLYHRVHFAGGGDEEQTFIIKRPITMIGAWWAL
jgi:hypothetical protein